LVTHIIGPAASSFLESSRLKVVECRRNTEPWNRLKLSGIIKTEGCRLQRLDFGNVCPPQAFWNHQD